jgi:hypothetical protein
VKQMQTLATVSDRPRRDYVEGSDGLSLAPRSVLKGFGFDPG